MVLTFVGIFGASAGQKAVKLSLIGQEFGKKLELRALSVGKQLAPSRSYTYRLEGSCAGTGDLTRLIPKGTPVSKLMNQLSPGNAKFLSGVRSNSNGKLPIVVFRKTLKGKLSHPTVGVVTLKMTLKAGASENGEVYLEVTGVRIRSLGKVSGTIRFERGSRLIIEPAPVIQFMSKVERAAEAVVRFNVVVTRSGNKRKVASVRYATADGTAGSGDYTATSGVIVFAKNQTRQIISIPITNNGELDGNRAFTIRLTTPSDGAVTGKKDICKVVIQDDD